MPRKGPPVAWLEANQHRRLAPYMSPNERLITLTDQQETVGVNPLSREGRAGMLRDEMGRWVHPDSQQYDDEYEASFWGTVERLWEERHAPRPPSARTLADLRRAMDREEACVVCGRALSGRRDSKTCSDRCRQALARKTRASVHPYLARPSRLCRSRLGVGMRTLAPLMQELCDAVERAWAVPMPDDQDERGWRMGQAEHLFGIYRDERVFGPSLPRFRRKVRAFIRRMERLAPQETER